MKFKIDAVIKFYRARRLKLKKEINFITPSSTKIRLFSTDEDLKLEMTIVADNQNEANSLAEIELARTVNWLSWLDNISISENRITSIICHTKPSADSHVLDITNFVCSSDNILILEELDPELIEKLKENLERNYLVDLEDIIYMWREAISVDSMVLRYLLLYRLLESLHGGRTELEQWIKDHEPNVQIITATDPRDKNVTIYTYLRDNMHSKERKFPFQKILDILPIFQNLVRLAIEEKCPIYK